MPPVLPVQNVKLISTAQAKAPPSPAKSLSVYTQVAGRLEFVPPLTFPCGEGPC